MAIQSKDFATGKPKFFSMEGFEGFNTKATRPGIEDQQLSWCENWMPIGKNHLRTLYGKGSTLYTAPRTLIYEYAFNIGVLPYHFLVMADGSAVAVRTDSGAVTTIAGAGTFFNGTTLPQAAQWNNTYINIIASTGYYIWDGSLLYGPGTIAPYSDASLVSPGLNYTSTPSVTISGGGGSGATATATVANGVVTNVTVTNPGTGYTSEPTITISGGGSPGGGVASMQVINGGANYTSAPTVGFVGGGGSGATATAILTAGIVTSFNITAAGSGYTGQPTVTFTGGGGSGAVALAVVANVAAVRLPTMPSGITGTCIENFQSRAWVGFSNKVAFTAPNSIANFATSAGGGVFPSNDSTLRVQFTHLQASNGFLYLYGDSSVSVVSNVQTSGSPATTTFNVANVDPQIGTPWRDSLDVFGRGIVSATTSGVYACYGGSVEKVSDPLDGLLIAAPAPPTAGDMTQFPQGAVMTIYDIRCYLLLYTVTDPFTGLARKILLIWDGQKWFQGSQEVTLTDIWTQEFNGNLVAWGTDGTNVFKLFNQASASLTKKVQSKLWAGDSITVYKNTFRLYTEILANGAQPVSLTVNVDSDLTTLPVTASSASVLTFVNNSGGVIQFQNNALANIFFTVAGLAIIGQDVAASGRLLGLTCSTTNPDETLLLVLLLYENSAIYG